MKHKLKVVFGDITKLQVDAIVNAANNSLLGGGGVDGAIHRAAGFDLLEECKTLNGCETGKAKITKGYLLPAKYVIHTVGPVYYNWPEEDAAKLLNEAYWNALQLTNRHRIKTIAFPNISTGVYAYPKEPAARIAIDTCLLYLKKDPNLDQIVFCCFDQENFKIYTEIMDQL